MKLLLILLSFSASAYVCQGEFRINDFKQFSSFENLDLDLKACLEKTQKLCEESKKNDFDKLFLESRTRAMSEVIQNKDFQEFYCMNFEKGAPSYDSDRKCKASTVLIELKDKKDCESFVSKDHEDYELYATNCNYYLNEVMEKSLGQWRKNLFKNKLKVIKENYKKLYPNKKVHKILDQISNTTNFNFRLSSFVAGARSKEDLSSDCMVSDEPWCKSDYVILPGGKIYLKPENLELVLAHEIGHIINDVQKPKEYTGLIDKIQKCNHLGSKNIKNLKDELEEETSADIHMAKYANEFMDLNKINDHFCNYKATHKYEKKPSYLNSIHRQGLVNCF